MNRGLLLLILGQLVTFNHAAIANTTDVIIKNPSRNFGYYIGDVLHQSISLQHEGKTHTIAQLPVNQREGRWVSRTAAHISDDGKWLNLQYQIINAPQSVRVAQLPAVTLQTEQGHSVDVPAWPFSVAPLIPTLESSDSDGRMAIMQSDWLPQPRSTTGTWLRITQLGTALAATILCWLFWWIWRNRQESLHLPFARAYHYIRKHPAGSGPENKDVWFALHRAFDTAAGRSINGANLDELIACTPWLKPFTSDLQSFFSMSSRKFFSPESSDDSLNPGKLAERLYKSERRHSKSISRPNTRIEGLP